MCLDPSFQATKKITYEGPFSNIVVETRVMAFSILFQKKIHGGNLENQRDKQKCPPLYLESHLRPQKHSSSSFCILTVSTSSGLETEQDSLGLQILNPFCIPCFLLTGNRLLSVSLTFYWVSRRQLQTVDNKGRVGMQGKRKKQSRNNSTYNPGEVPVILKEYVPTFE